MTGELLAAFPWLKDNNPIYHDIDIDHAAIAAPPEGGGG